MRIKTGAIVLCLALPLCGVARGEAPPVDTIAGAVRQRVEELFRDGTVSTQTAEHHTTRDVAIEQVARTLVANHGGAGILRQQFRATVSTARQTGERSWPSG